MLAVRASLRLGDPPKTGGSTVGTEAALSSVRAGWWSGGMGGRAAGVGPGTTSVGVQAGVGRVGPDRGRVAVGSIEEEIAAGDPRSQARSAVLPPRRPVF